MKGLSFQRRAAGSEAPTIDVTEAPLWKVGTPTYANDETRETAARMLAAHGGIEAWEATGSFAFTANMYLASVPLSGDGFERTHHDNWRHYRVTIEPATSRGTVELPLETRMARVIEAYVEVGGLLIPRSYTTLMETDDGVRMLGVHLVLDPEVSADFHAPSASPREGSSVVLSHDPAGGS